MLILQSFLQTRVLGLQKPMLWLLLPPPIQMLMPPLPYLRQQRDLAKE
jgi:hypothetical protein